MSFARFAGAAILAASVGMACRTTYSGNEDDPTIDKNAGDASPTEITEPGPVVDPNPGAPIPDGHPWIARNAGTTAFLRGVWCSPKADVVIAVGYQGTIVRSTDRGATWSTIATGATTNFEAAWGSSRDDIYVVGDGGVILHSTDGGEKFEALTGTGITRQLFTVWGSGPQNVFTAGYGDATIYRSRDRGKTWQAINTPALSGIGKIWGIGSSTIYANSAAGILASHDSGDKFALILTSLAQQNRIWAASPQDIYTVNKAGVVTRTDETTNEATKTSPTPIRSLVDVWGTGVDDVYVVGGDGRIAHSNDRNAKWTVQASGTKSAFYAIHGADGEAFAVGENGALVQRSASIGGDAGAADASTD